MGMLSCSSEGCGAVATEVLYLHDQPGHIHDCRVHAHDVREFCDVVASAPIADGVCPAKACSEEPIWTGAPTPLDGAR